MQLLCNLKPAPFYRQLNELSTTNNFLLDQNAQLRISLKAAAVDSGSQAGQPVPGI
jgi:hypothetical protein